jgi:hypothetical protein
MLKDPPMYSLYPKEANSPLGAPRLPNERERYADRTAFIREEIWQAPGCVK